MHVAAHLAVTLDGTTTGFTPDVARFYELAGTWAEDVTLVGADTILAQEPALTADGPGPAPDGPVLAVVDSRRRVSRWAALRNAGRWSEVVALRSAGSGSSEAHVEEIAAGSPQVDLGAALAELGRRGAEVVRVDSGGSLVGALLAADLLDEVSLLVHPLLGGGPLRWYGATAPRRSLSRLGCTELGEGLVWLRYSLIRP
jgi:2,5-diamino-6-(ribosylamino)-4(3H)-pyrimidinone 5'-phosphate reductase